MGHFSSEKTVRLLIRRRVGSEEQILLTHEKDERAKKDERGQSGKSGGWSLPGGGIKKQEKEIFEEIKKLHAVQLRFPKEGGGDRHASQEEYAKYLEVFLGFNDPPVSELKVILTAVKEGLEESGLLIKPVYELFREPTPNSFNNHELVLLDCEVVAGLLQTRSIETDDCRWFGTEKLPDGLYRKHGPWIKRGLEIVRQLEIDPDLLIETVEN